MESPQCFAMCAEAGAGPVARTFIKRGEVRRAAAKVKDDKIWQLTHLLLDAIDLLRSRSKGSDADSCDSVVDRIALALPGIESDMAGKRIWDRGQDRGRDRGQDRTMAKHEMYTKQTIV